MTYEIIKQGFLDAAEAWICDGYSTDIRFIARIEDDGQHLWDASVALYPLQPKQDISFQINCSNIIIGHIQKFHSTKKSLIELLTKAASGVLPVFDKELFLPGKQPFSCYSEMNHRDRWFSELHLQVSGQQTPLLSQTALISIDNALRSAEPPFDGLNDAVSWLGLRAPDMGSNYPTINIRVGPPIDLIFDQCELSSDELELTLHAHPKFDLSTIGLALRTVPGDGLNTRMQVASKIKWGRVRNKRREGKARIHLQNADSVLVMLMIGHSTVRRQWLLDPTRARNNRLLAIQSFDKDLRMVRQAVLGSSDSSKFEKGVAALLFLLGFSPALQLETDAPDLIVTTPSGRLVIVECTTRIADFASKIGKLVDRRGALSKSLSASGHPAKVYSVLVCRLPRDQISAHAEDAHTHKTILVAGEELEKSFERVRFPSDPDRLLDDALNKLGPNLPFELT